MNVPHPSISLKVFSAPVEMDVYIWYCYQGHSYCLLVKHKDMGCRMGNGSSTTPLNLGENPKKRGQNQEPLL